MYNNYNKRNIIEKNVKIPKHKPEWETSKYCKLSEFNVWLLGSHI